MCVPSGDFFKHTREREGMADKVEKLRIMVANAKAEQDSSRQVREDIEKGICAWQKCQSYER